GLDEPATGKLISIPETRRGMLNDLALQRGRWIEPGHSDEVIISETFANANGLQIGQSITAILNGRLQKLRIVGMALSPEYVYEVRGAGVAFPDNKRFGIIWMSEGAMAAAFDLVGAFNDLAVMLSRGTDELAVIASIDRILKPYGSAGAFGREDQMSARFLADEIRQNRATANIIPAIFLAVAAFLLHIVLTRLISTQRDQVAVLKAFGYSNGQIAMHYLQLALLAVALGAVIGIAAGIYFGSLLTDVYALFYHFPFRYYSANVTVMISSTIITVIAAAIGALGAVRRAIALPPAEAMRPESPATFKPGLLERLGISKHFSPAFRMVMRGLERQKFKAVLSIFAMALAGAILIISRYTMDGIDYVLDLHFYKVQQEDVTLAFFLPTDAKAKYEIRHLPGIMQYEAFRSVPVKMMNGHLNRRVAIMGLEPKSDLRRLIGQDLKYHEVPQEGVGLTTYLAKLLDVQVGDTLTVELLEKNGEIAKVAVTSVIDEIIGISGYMTIENLNRLNKEGPVISGITATVDPLQKEALNAELKHIPKIGAATFREVMLKGFEETVAQNMQISNTVLTMFAIIIALGVIYNGGRIALSERGRELASLRVLGFTKGEVTLMLLGEQLILLLFGIPTGIVLGYYMASQLPAAFESELMRLPFFLSLDTYIYTALVMLGAFVLSALMLRRRLYSLDLIGVLKTRE
ncbi:MAG TPA: ABC transporter permease, partial [Candidatus Kapabacteria bacterium]|nr:ABC transporter permease [Candidatus Kapabacteria bacterium]